MWLGAHASPTERASALDTARRFAAAQAHMDGRPVDAPLLTVRAGEEPPHFTCNFVGWSFDAANVFDDPYEARLAQLRGERPPPASARATGSRSPPKPARQWQQ